MVVERDLLVEYMVIDIRDSIYPFPQCQWHVSQPFNAQNGWKWSDNFDEIFLVKAKLENI